MVVLLLGKRWRFMAGCRGQPGKQSLPGADSHCGLHWLKHSAELQAGPCSLSSLTDLSLGSFFFSFLVKLWPKDTSFTYVISTGWWWGSSGQRLSIDNALANILKPCCLIPRASTTLSALKVTVFPGSPVVKTSWSPCRPPGLIPDQGTRSHMPQRKVLHATAKTWHSPIKVLPVFSQDSFVPQL